MPATDTTTRAGEKAPEALSLTALIDHIELSHHAYVRATLRRLDELTEQVCGEDGRGQPQLRDLREGFNVLAQEMVMHLLREERILFPIIREADAGQLQPGELEAMLGPTACMTREHDMIDEILAYLRGVTEAYAPPAEIAAGYAQILAELAGFEADTREHVRKENEILFPRALALVPTAG